MYRVDTPRRVRGFTLIEILVALAVFSVLAVIAYQGVARMASTKLVLDADNRKWRELTVALARFDEDFSQAANRQWRDEGGISLPAVRGSAGAIDSNGAQLELVRFDGGQLIHLGYRLRENTLELLLWPSLDLAPRSAPTALPLLEKVSRFQVRFLDENSQWQLSWPQGSKNEVLPRGVELVLTLQSGETITRLFVLP
ncbi:type II secretion system minor pseudopilin GspJ [Chitinimonas sp. PSY-7]|uniref:type II secretion system minor pseudopilin GspJ n=1 Tax=Chitinimonas sp. PSY-7 TaxID=3459088 RepID=UPI00403FF965